jgi:P-type Cu2+ transporter
MGSHDHNHEEQNHGNDHNHDQKNHSHHDHHKMMVQDFKFRFWWVLVLTIPILALSPMIQQFMGVEWRFTGDSWILTALSTVVFSLADGHF